MPIGRRRGRTMKAAPLPRARGGRLNKEGSDNGPDLRCAPRSIGSDSARADSFKVRSFTSRWAWFPFRANRPEGKLHANQVNVCSQVV